MKFEHTEVMNFEGAFRGMRNPKNSWNKSDSYFGFVNQEDYEDWDIAEKWATTDRPDLAQANLQKYNEDFETLTNEYNDWLLANCTTKFSDQDDVREVALIGPDDMDLACRLIKGGPEHRKFLRQIFVSVDITAPLFIWKELDTYKVATTANSTSTMHKLASTPITIDCFEIDDMYEPYTCSPTIDFSIEGDLIPALETLRKKYVETKDKRYWKELIRWLPESWLQTRTWTCNYETLMSICKQRKGHKLTEWKTFIDWARTLPYSSELIFAEGIDWYHNY